MFGFDARRSILDLRGIAVVSRPASGGFAAARVVRIGVPEHAAIFG
jgi:hypothetical protein